MQFFRNLLGSRWLCVFLVLAAIVIHIPSLGGGWLSDDLTHRVKFLSYEGVQGLRAALMDSYIWITGGDQVRQVIYDGLAPWWTHEGFHLTFWRPVTALTQWIDYAFWPQSAVLMHAQSILWFLLAILAVSALYRRITPVPWAAGLALCIFAIDDLHLVTVGWLAARNAILATVFGVLAIRSHDLWRRDGKGAHAYFAVLLLGLSLLSAEAGVGAVGYLAAYAIFIDRASVRSRLISVTPAVMVVVVWRMLYRGLGFAAEHTGIYIDPVSNPFLFIKGLLLHGPMLIMSALGAPNPQYYMDLSPLGTLYFWLAGIGFCVVLLLCLPIVLKDRQLSFWLLGMLLCMVPLGGNALPGDRSLLLPSVGVAAAIAHIIARWGERPAGTGRKPLHVLHGALCALLLILHVGIPAARAAQRYAKGWPDLTTREMIPRPGLPPHADTGVWVIVNHPDPSSMMHVPAYRDIMGESMPDQLLTLAPSFSPVEITRSDEATIEVESAAGFATRRRVFSSAAESIDRPMHHHTFVFQRISEAYRPWEDTLKPGDTAQVGGVSIEVLPAAGDRGQRARFVFERPIEDPSVQWLQWDWDQSRFVPFEPPPVGEIVYVAGPFG